MLAKYFKLKSFFFITLFISLIAASFVLYIKFYIYEDKPVEVYNEILTKQERIWLNSHPNLKIAPDPMFAPIEYFDENGEYKGITADYIRYIEKKINYKFTVVKFKTWADLLESAKKREIDIITAAQPTDQRKSYLNFTEDMLDIPNMIVTNRNVVGTISVNDLFGKKVAVTKGYAIYEHIKTKYPQIDVVETKSDLEAIQKTAFGETFAAILNVAIASYEIQKNGISNLKVAGNTELSNPLAIASRNDCPILNDILNKGLQSIPKKIKDDIYTNRIRLSLDSNKFSKETTLVIFSSVAFILAIFILILFWNWSLKQKVKENTSILEKELEERNLIENALLEKDTLLNFALNSNNSSAFDNNFKTGDCTITPAIFLSLGYDLPDIPTKIEKLGEFIHPDDLVVTMQAVQRHLDDERIPYYAEFRMKDKSGNWIWVNGSGRVFERDENGVAIRLLGLSTIIDDRKKSEDEIKRINSELEDRVEERTEQLNNAMNNLRIEIDERIKTEKELLVAKDDLSRALAIEKELNELKSRFVAMVSHEYRTPLTVILSSTFLLEKFFEFGDSEGFKKYLLRIQNTVELMTELLEKVLFLGKTDSKNTILKFTDINLLDCIKYSTDDAKSQDCGNHIIEYHNENEELVVHSDERMLNHIILNLVANAIKYSPAGSEVHIYSGVHHNRPYIEVKDKGIGIPKEEMDKLFDPFHRFANVGAIEGSGLGLAIVKRCCDLIGAEITVISELNKGSSFVITLPPREN